MKLTKYIKVSRKHPYAQDMLDHLINCLGCTIIAYYHDAILLACNEPTTIDIKV